MTKVVSLFQMEQESVEQEDWKKKSNREAENGWHLLVYLSLHINFDEEEIET